MTIAWMYNKKSSLMGEVIEDTGRHYVVKVTSWSDSRHKKLEGKKFMVNKNVAQVVK